MLLSPVPTLRQKKGTEKLVPVTCAHVEAEEGHRRSSSTGGKPALTMQVQYCSYIGLYCFSSIKLISGSKDRNIKAKKYHPGIDMPAVYLTGAYHCHPGGRSMRSSILFIIPVKRNPWNSSSGSIQSVWQ